MRGIYRPVVLALAALCAGGVSLEAQEAPRGLVEVEERTRRGFWIAAGIGAGAESYEIRGDGLGYSDELTQPTISLRLGGTVSQHLRLGGEALVWFHEVSGATESLSSLLFIGQWYPLSRAGFYLKGGAGIGRSGVDFRDGYSIADVGFAVLGGAGWEIGLSRRLALTPVFDVAQHFYSTDRGGGGYRERLVHLGIGLLFQAGP